MSVGEKLLIFFAAGLSLGNSSYILMFLLCRIFKGGACGDMVESRDTTPYLRDRRNNELGHVSNWDTLYLVAS